jgi:hypothetical protein
MIININHAQYEIDTTHVISKHALQARIKNEDLPIKSPTLWSAPATSFGSVHSGGIDTPKLENLELYLRHWDGLTGWTKNR